MSINEKIIYLLIIILICMLTINIKNKFFNKIIKKIEVNNEKKKLTYIKLISNIINYIIIIIAFIIILKFFGIDVTSILAGIGVVSIIAGLALQDALKDIIMGFNIIIDNYFNVGDVIYINNTEAKVLEVGVKSIKVKDINNDNIIIIANRNISESIKISDILDISIPLPYEEKINDMENIINEIIENSKENKNIKKIKYLGINEFDSSAIIYKIRVYCQAEYKPSVKRYLLREIKIKLDSKNISIPYNQIDIHQKKN